jgi:hypothetical protein
VTFPWGIDLEHFTLRIDHDGNNGLLEKAVGGLP